jgi:hypothetical protein
MAMPTYGDDHGHRRAHPRVDAGMLGRAGDGINHGGMRRRPVVRASALVDEPGPRHQPEL